MTNTTEMVLHMAPQMPKIILNEHAKTRDAVLGLRQLFLWNKEQVAAGGKKLTKKALISRIQNVPPRSYKWWNHCIRLTTLHPDILALIDLPKNHKDLVTLDTALGLAPLPEEKQLELHEICKTLDGHAKRTEFVKRELAKYRPSKRGLPKKVTVAEIQSPPRALSRSSAGGCFSVPPANPVSDTADTTSAGRQDDFLKFLKQVPPLRVGTKSRQNAPVAATSLGEFKGRRTTVVRGHVVKTSSSE